MSEPKTEPNKRTIDNTARQNSHYRILEDLGVTNGSSLFMRAKKAVILAGRKLKEAVKGRAPAPSVQQGATPTRRGPSGSAPRLG